MILKVPSSNSSPMAADRDRSNWYYEKLELRRTKSIEDGISYETEQRYRREAARFIIKVGTKMNLRYDTMATGVVYLHRFYMCHSFKNFPRFVTACCCLFLAGKVEETPKKCKDIIKIARMHLTDSQFLSFGEDPKEEMLTLERILLQTINFDLQVDHPYQYLLRYAKALVDDKEKIQKMVQMAWTFINDSLCTTICLQWEPEIIAIALMFLAGKLSKFEVSDWEGRLPRQKKWWDMFVEDMSTEILEDICHQVLDLYSTSIPEQPQDSPPSSPAPALPGGLPPTVASAIQSPAVIHSPMVMPGLSQPPPNRPPMLPSIGGGVGQKKPPLLPAPTAHHQHQQHQLQHPQQQQLQQQPPPPPPPMVPNLASKQQQQPPPQLPHPPPPAGHPFPPPSSIGQMVAGPPPSYRFPNPHFPVGPMPPGGPLQTGGSMMLPGPPPPPPIPPGQMPPGGMPPMPGYFNPNVRPHGPPFPPPPPNMGIPPNQNYTHPNPYYNN